MQSQRTVVQGVQAVTSDIKCKERDQKEGGGRLDKREKQENSGK